MLTLGGIYIPLVNFRNVFEHVIKTVIFEEYTLRQALLHVPKADIERNSSFNYSSIADRVHAMIVECETINDIRKSFFAHSFLKGYAELHN